MRKRTVFSVIILLLTFTLILTACSGGSSNVEEEPEVTVASIKIDATSVPQSAYAGEVDLSSIRLEITYSDGTGEIIGLTESMIAVNDRTKLNTVGTHIIKVNYPGATTSFQITLKQKEKATYKLTVYNGRPIAINGVELEEGDIVMDGDKFEQVYEEGTVVTLEWIPIAGYFFTRWTDNGSVIDTQSVTKVTMNGTHEYRAYSDPVVNTVSFETNGGDPISPRKTNILYETDIVEPEREGYVFDGWTTTRVTGDDAIDCTAAKISFPYEVKLETTLYATWRVLGLEYNEYVNAFGDSGWEIVSYVKNDKELLIPEVYKNKPVLAISANAFENATLLEKIYIPASVETLGEGFLRNCGRLKTIEVSLDSDYFMTIDGVLYDDLGEELIAYPAGKLQAVVLPDSIKKIASYAFYDAVVGGVELPSGLKTIGSYAFDSVHIDYVSFTSVNPNDSGFSVGSNIFNDEIEYIFVSAANLNVFKSIKAFADKEDRISTDEGDIPVIEVNPAGTLLYKTIYNENSENAATTLEIIGADRSLTEILLPYSINGYSVSSIGVKAFNGCVYLNKFTIPNTTALERILEGAFDGTPYLETLENKEIIANNVLYKYYGTADTYVLGRTITRIAESAFQGNTALKYLDLSDNSELRYIGPFAFYGCTSFVGDVSGAGLTVKSNLTTIGNYAFAYSGLKGFYLSSQGGSNLTEIGQGAFMHCYYLVGVELGAKTSSVATDAFLYDYSLLEFVVESGNSVFTATDGVLYQSSLSNSVYDILFAYPAGKMATVFDVASSGLTVSGIGEYAFFASNIKALRISSSVSNINSAAIYIPGLIYVTFETLIPGMTYEGIFVTDINNLGKYAPEYVTVEDETSPSFETLKADFFGTYLSEKYRQNASTELVISDNLVLRVDTGKVTVVGSARNEAELTIPATYGNNSVTVIAPYAFMGNYLKTLYLGSNIATISANALSYASVLAELYTVAGMSIPTVQENSFGASLDNGLRIYVSANQKDLYMRNWNLSARYLIDIEVGHPEAVLVYKPGEEGDIELPSFNEVIAPEEFPVPTRPGYSFEGWYDEQNNKIDTSVPYVIPYNTKLTCNWKAMEYTVNFVLGDLASMEGETTVTVAYGSHYEFETPTYVNGSKILKEWKTVNGTVISPVGIWEYLVDSTIDLYPVWEDVVYVLVYDTEEGSVTVANESISLLYGETATLDVPTKTGYEFLGWMINRNGKEVLLTYSDGTLLLPWSYNDATEFNVYASWKAKEGIIVNLYFNQSELYKTVTVTYGEEFLFPYDVSEMSEEWANKAEFFCGWYEAFDIVTQTGGGRRFTDETGAGLFPWDIDPYSGEMYIYAQFPLEISDGTQLEELDLSELSRSFVLVNDITVTKPIGSKIAPYSGIFNGNGYTVTFDYTVNAETLATDYDGYVGLFAYNKGTVKNFVLKANITVEDLPADIAAHELCVGAVAGKNEGVITGCVTAKDGSAYDVYATVNVNVPRGKVTSAHIGSYVGYNAGGTVENVALKTEGFTIAIDGVPYEEAPNRDGIYCGVLCGTYDGGLIASSESCTYVYYNDNDPFISAKCGQNIEGEEINVLLTAVKGNQPTE